MAQINWRQILFWALLGTAAVVFVTLANTVSTYKTLGGLVDTGPHDPPGSAMHTDMPSYPELEAGGHDGADFYVIARQPMHPTSAARNLDRPRYRLQRILFPWLAWVLHPSGGGIGLIWAMFAVGVAGVLAGSVATGALIDATRRSPLAGPGLRCDAGHLHRPAHLHARPPGPGLRVLGPVVPVATPARVGRPVRGRGRC